MQRAVASDQAVLDNELRPVYIDNQENLIDKEQERIQLLINDCQTLTELDVLQKSNPDFPIELYNIRKEELSNGNS